MGDGIRVAILGASGYGAGELARLLTQHPHAQIVAMTSTSAVGEPVAALHPHLRGFYDLTVSAAVDYDALLATGRGVVFSALPSGASGAAVAAICEARAGDLKSGRLRIIDLSGDLRLRDKALHAKHYPESGEQGPIRELAAYGLTELNREAIASARIIANPGCLATAAILALAPLARIGIVGTAVADAKTGSSGSGRQLKDTTHHPTRHADFRAYKPLGHQHEPEILQALAPLSRGPLSLSFVPQSMDTSRGIFATIHVELAEELTTAALRMRFAEHYPNCPFVRIVDGSPTLQDVVGSNFCDIAVATRGRRAIVMAALDNLVKGMAGAAIQNMNVMHGLDERTGLWTPSLRPV